jgi:hypothetical protein
MFREHFKDYRFAFLRGLLTIYPFILLIDARIAKRNTWYPEFLMFLFCSLFAFVAGIAYDGYYYNRQKQKEYPTLRKFRQTAALGAVIFAVLLYGILLKIEELPRVTYALSRGMVAYLFMGIAFFARDAKKEKKTDFLLAVPSLIITILLYFIFPGTRRIYGNLAMLTLVFHGILYTVCHTRVPDRIRESYKRFQSKHRIGALLKKWSAFFNKAWQYAVELFKSIGKALKSITVNFTLFKGMKRLIVGIYRFFRKDKGTKISKHSDYIDEIDTLFGEDRMNNEIRYTVRGLMKIKDPVKKVRYAFGLVMWNLKEKKVGIKYYDTVPVIEEKSKVIENLDPYMKPLCELYQDVRYGDRKVNALSSEQAADLAISADETIKASYYQPKTYANSDFDFRRE